MAEPERFSRLRKPEAMSLETWQVALRRQFARQEKFRVKYIDTEPGRHHLRPPGPQSTRNTVCCMGQGQAAGTAATLCAAGNCGSRELPYPDLRQTLEAAAVHFEA